MKRALLAAVAAALLAPAGAAAEIDFPPCGSGPLECGTVAVPIDRSGQVPGTIDLAVYRAPATGVSRGVLIGLPGGPGDGGRGYFVRRLAAFAAARATHDLVFIDPRGAGRSAPLQCDDAAACASELGAAAHLYTSRDIADDVEAVRAALGVEKVALYGISYGAWFAQTYARRYPDRVTAIALDAPVSRQDIDDPFNLDDYAGLPVALRALCPCPRDPYRDAAAVIRGLRPELRVSVAEAAGTVDLNPAVRTDLGAVAAAMRAGDEAPLNRLIGGALLPAKDDRERYNPGANVVTQCEERVLPWDRTAPLDQRATQAQQRLAAIPASTFAPFEPVTALLGGVPALCLQWPVAPDSPIVEGPLPAVPTLVLAGDADVRRSVLSVRRFAASLPGARYVEVGDVGHGVLAEDPTGCGSRALASVLTGAPVTSTCRAAGLRPRPPFARSLSSVPAGAVHGPGGGRERSVVAAAILTATDAINQAAMRIDARRRDFTSVTFAGLRGGRTHGDDEHVVLRSAQWLRGLKVSGVARANGRHLLRVAGLARGTLRVRGTSFAGRIGRRTVRGTLDLGPLGGAGTPVGAML